MKEQSWSYVDKQSWNPGPWQTEPDKVQFTDEATGLPCLIVRGPVGALCGYVGVAQGHQFFNVAYNDCSIECGEEWGQRRNEYDYPKQRD